MSKTIAKISGLTLGVTLALGLSVNTVGAVTVAELQAQINALMAQLASLSGGTATVSANFTTDMTIGSTGSQVVALQQMLVAQGHLVMPAGVAYGYFGSLTRDAVMKWQAANGVSATGYFGPMSRAKANSMVAGGATGTVPGTTVGGGSTTGGSISTPGVEGTLTATQTSIDTEGEISSGDEKVGILSVELEADLSDIRVERIEVNLGADRDIYRDVADRIYVMEGSTVLASRDLDDDTVIENSDDQYVVTISGLNFIVREGQEEVITIAVDAQSSIDTDQEGESFTVTIPRDGIRGVDGAGINQYAPDTAIAETFDVEALAEGEIEINEGDENPDAGVVFIDEDDNTDEVLALAFELEANDQDVVIDSIPVGFVTSEDSGVEGPVRRAVLRDGSTVLDSVTIPSGAGTSYEVVFDDLDLDIEEGDTVELSVYVDLNDADATTFASGTTLYATTSDSAAWDAEDAEGDDASVSGSATGGELTFYAGGISATLESSDTEQVLNLDSTNSDNQGQYTIRVNVTAEEETAWIELSAASSTSANADDVGLAFFMENASNGEHVATGTVTATLSRVSGGTEEDGFVRINPGQNATLELVVYYDAAATGIYRVQLDSVGFNESEAQANQEIDLTPASDFESGSTQVLN